jgi:GntR family transcriptional regulator
MISAKSDTQTGRTHLLADPAHRVALDTGSSTPIYRQLADQIRWLVELGELAHGSRLPSASQLATNLDVHRNTIQKAYRTLQRQNVIVTDHRRGTFVGSVKPLPRRASERLFQLMDQLVLEAERTNVDGPDLATMVQVHATRLKALRSRSVIFVECNATSLAHYQQEIEKTVGIGVQPVLLEDVTKAVATDTSSFVVTTFFHYADVRRRLLGRGSELVAISVKPHLEVLQQLNSLKPGTSLGVVYLTDDPYAATRLQRMHDAVKHLGLEHVTVQQVAVTPSATEMEFAGLDAVLIRPENISLVRKFIPRGVRVIEWKNTLDEASVQLLREMLGHG